MAKDEPVGECEIIDVKQLHQNSLAVFARITVRDENGDKFYFDASCFNFNLRRAGDGKQ